MTTSSLAKSLRVNLFADRGSNIGEAWQYVENMFDSMPEAGARAAARTALHVLVNTIANAIDEEYYCGTPATIAHADQPDVGIDESRIAHMVDLHMARWMEENLDIENQVQEAIDEQDIEHLISEAIKNMNFRVDISAD
tara:strand:- start:774 stop:1190 length:417 start_codon:yes stop_codon:yes gene_type:complete